jgi:cyclopropane fatty-acyl-phospholipid synthase-like methyltransferase
MTSDSERVQRFKREVEKEWRSSQVSAAYRKWSREESDWGRAARELMIDRARLAPGMRVLDVGSAHGEPGLAIAEAVGSRGSVTMVDIDPDLLELAAERAQQAGLSNVTTQVADAHALPFPDVVAAPVQTWMESLSGADREQAFAQIYAALNRYYDGERVNVPIDVIVGSGRKPELRSD